ncbi:MAG: hypothetical protein IT451_02115, partial [Candidatus Brocadia sp.]|nr:hypothetical protein [Candidatus Brocadia sp.]
MINFRNYSQDCFSPVYRQIVSSCYAGENDARANGSAPMHVLEGTERLIKEELVRCVWFGQHIKKDKLYTDDGSR